MDKEILPSAIPLPLPDEILEELVQKSKDWALMHGIAMRSKTHFSQDSLDIAPFILTPSAIPRNEFEKAQQLQPLLNELQHKVAHDFEFLDECLKNTIKADEFTNNLFQIYKIIRKEGFTQPISLGLLRSDYMLDRNLVYGAHRGCCCWKQVEFNTIASGFGWLGPASAIIHRFVLQQLGHSSKLINLPENNALQGLCAGMLEAHKIYGKPHAIILFIVEEVAYNICDQRFHEFEIGKMNPDVKIKRRTFSEIADRAHLGENKELIIDGFEVAVVYFRSGYVPELYVSQKDWDARLLVERSLAIKCPSIQLQLSGTKKVQQELARPGVLERFFKNSEDIRKVRGIFTGLYSLDFDEYGEQGVRLALEDPERYVLKPQRDGGGNNIYGKTIAKVVNEIKNSKERTAWILMERIHPPVARSYMIRPGCTNKPEIVNLISELGIFGVIIGDAKKIIYNKHAGHMLRTKAESDNEGGIVAGFGALDSPYLID